MTVNLVALHALGKGLAPTSESLPLHARNPAATLGQGGNGSDTNHGRVTPEFREWKSARNARPADAITGLVPRSEGRRNRALLGGWPVVERLPACGQAEAPIVLRVAALCQ
jgi:hypothetical protein